MTTATYAPTAPINTTPPQLQPYGLGTELLRSLSQANWPIAGQMIGLGGNQQFGTQIGSTFGSLASLMPFGVSPSQVTNPQQALQVQLAQQQAQLAQQQALLQQQAIAHQQAIAQQQAIAHQQAVAQHVLAQHVLAQQANAQPYGHLMPFQNPYAQFGYWQN